MDLQELCLPEHSISESIDAVEQTVSDIIFEVVCIEYGVEHVANYFNEEAQAELRNYSEFSIQADPIQSIALYVAEYPNLFINCSTEGPPEENEIRLMWSSDVGFYDRLEQRLAPLGYWHHLTYSAKLTLNKEWQDLALITKSLKQYGLKNANTSFSELLFYTRQAVKLELVMRHSEKFNLAPEFSVSTYIHDWAEDETIQFKECINATLNKPLSELYQETGLSIVANPE